MGLPPLSAPCSLPTTLFIDPTVQVRARPFMDYRSTPLSIEALRTNLTPHPPEVPKFDRTSSQDPT